MTDNKNIIPIWEKYTLTLTEAAEYFNISETKLRQIVNNNIADNYILKNGVKILIKRRSFEKFLDDTYSI